jgi:hypothetical protein
VAWRVGIKEEPVPGAAVETTAVVHTFGISSEIISVNEWNA